MSHNRQKMARKSNSFRIFLIGSLFISLFALFDMLSVNAHAATLTGPTHKSNPSMIFKSDLAALSGNHEFTLDWRTQSYDINFQLPSHDWYEALDLFISATPEGRVSKRTPLLISFNGAAPIALNGQGSRFDAHIRLDTSRIRARNNTVTITYQTPSDASCLTAEHGKWNFNLSRAKLVATTRAKSKSYNISEMEARLSHPMTSPKRVAILAHGPNKYALEAILAQGVAQRTHILPQFQFASKRSDFTVIIGTNQQLRRLVTDKSLLNENAPSLFMDKGVQPKLVLSAPNDAQLMELAQAFSTFHLPRQYRKNISLFDLYAAGKLLPRPSLTAHQYLLGDIGDVTIAPSWQPAPSHVQFNVDDARASSGVLTLNIASSENLQPNSRLNLSLNGESIGYTKLDKTSKNVAFNMPAGSLKPSGNRLTFTPELVTNETGSTCAVANITPAVLVSAHSKLNIKHAAPTPIADLSRLAGNGSVFGQSAQDTALILTANSTKDRAASLQFLGYAARQFGPKWVSAAYYTSLPSPADLNKNILMIGPNAPLDNKLIANAPRAVKLALAGNTLTGTTPATLPLRQAANNETQAFKLAARTIGVPSRIKEGGIASIFPSPYANGKLIAIISATQPAYYQQAIRSLTTPDYWNTLQGSVTRWDKKAILMAQTSSYQPEGFFPAKPPAKPFSNLTGNRFTAVKAGLGKWLAGFSLKKPPLAADKPATANQHVPSLRGTRATMPEPTQKAQKQPAPLYATSITFSELKTGLVTKFTNFKNGTGRFINTTFSAQGAENLLINIQRNRLVWTLIFALLIFFLLSFLTPKEAK